MKALIFAAMFVFLIFSPIDSFGKEGNLRQLHNIGITSNSSTGAGTVILNCEPDSGHGAATRDVIEIVAPGAKVLSAKISIGYWGDGIAYIRANGIDLETYLLENGVDIMVASLFLREIHPQYVRKMGQIRNRTGVIMINSAGNGGEGENTTTTFLPGAILVGAIDIVSRETFRRAEYSSTGPGLDFMAPTVIRSGTSFSAPVVAGMVAILIEKYGEMDQIEASELLKAYAIDAGEPGRDDFYGHGIPVLDDTGNKRDIFRP